MHEQSSAATKSELNIFSVPPTQVAVERSFFEEIRPVNTVTNAGPYDFSIDGSHYMIDLASNFLYLKIKIINNDGTDLADDTEVAPINLIGKTFLQQVKLFINSKLAYDSGPDYAFIAYLLTDLNYGRAAKETHLASAGYVLDHTEEVNDVDLLDTNVNPGWLKRKAWFRNSREVEFMSTLHVPFAHQEKYLLSNVDIRFELFRNTDRFALFCTGDQNYKIVVQDIKLYIRKVELGKDLSLAMEQALTRMTAKYPIRRLELKTIQVGQGRRTTPTNTLWNGQLPRRVVICMLSVNAYFGSYHHSPFVFRHHNVTKASLNVNGVVVPHSGPMEFRFREHNVAESTLVTRAYVQMYNALGIGTSDKSNDITYDRFKGDACYLVFDLSSDNMADGSNWELVRTGPLSIYLEFSGPIAADGLRVLVMGEFDNLITIDRNRNLFYDYAI